MNLEEIYKKIVLQFEVEKDSLEIDNFWLKVKFN